MKPMKFQTDEVSVYGKLVIVFVPEHGHNPVGTIVTRIKFGFEIRDVFPYFLLTEESKTLTR